MKALIIKIIEWPYAIIVLYKYVHLPSPSFLSQYNAQHVDKQAQHQTLHREFHSRTHLGSLIEMGESFIACDIK